MLACKPARLPEEPYTFSPNLEKAPTFPDGSLPPSTSHAVERGNRCHRWKGARARALVPYLNYVTRLRDGCIL